MSEVTAEQIETAETRLGERLLGKVHRLGEASFTLRALTNEDRMYLTGVQAGCEAEVRLAAVVEMTCRLGIEDWHVERTDGTTLKCEREPIRAGGPLAITKDCIHKLPYTAQYELSGEIVSLRDLSEAEGIRLDFTTALGDAAIPS